MTQNENFSTVEQNLHLKVLEKFINLFLFEKLSSPKFSAKNAEKEMDEKIVELMEFLQNTEDDNKDAKINDYFNLSIEDFRSKMSERDTTDLLCCYIDSNLKLILGLSRIFSSTNKIPTDSMPKMDYEMVSQLMNNDKMPEDLRQYLKTQFYDLLSFIPINTTVISKQQYLWLITKYVRKYEQNKVIDIMFDKSDVSEIN